MKTNPSRVKPGELGKAICWIASWVVIVGLGLDFYNWHKTPRLWWGLPGWLWMEVLLVLITALAFGLLARFAWEDE